MAREGFGRMKYLHIVPGADDVANGMARVARLLAKEQGDAVVVDLSAVSGQSLAVSEGSESLGFVESLEEVWVHGMWLPKEWAICRRVLRAGKRLVRMTHGSLSPVYLKQQGRWKKWLVGPIERSILRRCERIVATCDAEKAWIEAYLGKKCPEIVVEDVKRFFDLAVSSQRIAVSGEGEKGKGKREEGKEKGEEGRGKREEDFNNKNLNLLYLGRRHPLKGLEYLEQAVKELVVSRQSLVVSEEGQSNSKFELQNLELKIVSNAFGEELEKVWAWCDVLVLPTLSENFGLVVAEALERGKRVITTDGAPVWESLAVSGQQLGVSGDGCEIGVGCGGRLLYLKGYRDGSDEERVELLKKAILFLAAKGTKDDYPETVFKHLHVLHD